MQTKTHWDTQALTVERDAEVNIGDIYQRELEYDFILPHLKRDMNILEVGCGNDYSTSIFRQHVRHVDAFDVSPAMIERATRTFGETNNAFYVDDLLTSTRQPKLYDTVVCVRVLINLKDFYQQEAAIYELKKSVAPGGQLILIEGFQDGFDQIEKARRAVGLPALEPSGFNFYSHRKKLVNKFIGWKTIDTFHTGTYDYFTRVYYPLVVGADKVERNSVFARAAMELSRVDKWHSEYAREHGFVFRRAG